MMMTPTTCLGFNPCSGGSIALGLWVGAALPSPPLCFNPCSGGSIALGFPALPARFASYACFNPCSGGSIALGDRCHRPRPHHPPVSILVLVEVLPWDFLHFLHGLHHTPVSILVSGGSIALGDRCHRPRPHTLRFQSLFWWKYCPGGSTRTRR